MKGDLDIVFQVLTPAHAAELARLESAVFADAWSEARFADLLRGDRFLAVGGLNASGLQCYLSAYSLDREFEIVNVAVADSLRGRGVGRRLLDFFLRKVRDQRGGRVVLEVRSGNEAARALYSRCGFTTVGLRRAYYGDTGEDALVMEWSPCLGS